MTQAPPFPADAPRIASFGETALVFEAPGAFELATQQRIWALSRAAEAWEGIVETGIGVTNLLVVYDPRQWSAQRLRETLAQAWAGLPPLELPGRLWEFPVVYGGERGADLATVARSAGVSPREAASLHAEPLYTVIAPSVTPGFGYLFGMNPRLATPRRQTPVMLKEPGSVSVGGAQTMIGTMAGPSGWHAIGYTLGYRHPFDPFADPPLPIAVGDHIRFVIAEVLP